jgi:hypothetical protein
VIVLGLVWEAGLWAGPPIAYSGKISIYSSNYNGYAKLTFSMYDSNKTVVWRNGANENDSIRVHVKNGRYNVLLGGQGMNQIPSELFLQHNELYLKVEFENEDGFGKRHLKPDQRITASPYSLAAGYARIASSVVPNSITRNMLAPNVRNDLNRTGSSSDANRTITRPMLSSDLQNDLNRTITRSMLSSSVQSDLNRTITKSMLSSSVQSDLSRTITRSMLSSSLQSELSRTITRSMLSSSVQADLNPTIEANKLSANIKRYFEPSITTHPQDTTINVDTNGSLSVSGLGQFLTYQWKKDGSSLAGQTNATLPIIDANATLHEGNYTVVVANDFGSLESSRAEVSIADPPVEILVIAGGTSSANAVNAWQRILIPSPYTAYNISSVDLFLRGSSTVYLEVYDQSASVNTNPHTRFAGLTPVATSSSKAFNHSSFTAVNFEFPAGTTLNANPPYYVWAKYSNGTPQVQSTYNAGGTTGGRGNNPAILNVKVYGIAP